MIDINPDEVMRFLAFAEERHRIWERRQAGEPGPWTTDVVLNHHKFTNVFRVLDPGSQFVLTDLDDPSLDDREMLARLTLYRLTNLPDTWTYLRTTSAYHSGYPTLNQLDDDLIEAWNDLREAGNRVFSGAYMITPDGNIPGTDKIRTVVERVRRMFTEGSDVDVMPAWRAATTQAERFAALRAAPVIGDFMAMQILTDWGYCATSKVDREDEFAVLGPGARKGAKELGSAPVDEIHRYLVGAVRASPGCPRLPIDGDMEGIGDRLPSWMDVQNLLCEWSKYARFARKASGNASAIVPYQAAHPGPQPAPVLPAHWR